MGSRINVPKNGDYYNREIPHIAVKVCKYNNSVLVQARCVIKMIMIMLFAFAKANIKYILASHKENRLKLKILPSCDYLLPKGAYDGVSVGNYHLLIV